MRFERFTEGPDGGIDFRHQAQDALWIGQAKRYRSFSALLPKLRLKVPKMQRVNPQRYFLVTSCPLTPANKNVIRDTLAPFVKDTGDILGRNDLDALLSVHHSLLRRHFKLWLNDAAQINQVLHNGLHQRSHAALARTLEEARYFVPHQFVNGVQQQLAMQHVCLITGEPGAGKSALAGYIALQEHLSEPGRDFHWIRDRKIEDTLHLMQPGTKAVIVLDDFLGATFLSMENTLAWVEELAAVIRLAQRSEGNFRVLLTTRDYILEQAVARMDSSSRTLGALKRSAITLGSFNLKVRGEILYSYLAASDLPRSVLREACRAGGVSSGTTRSRAKFCCIRRLLCQELVPFKQWGDRGPAQEHDQRGSTARFSIDSKH